MKIFVTGFQNSGTTLVRRLLATHPDIRYIYHETYMLKGRNTRGEVRKYTKFDIDAYHWGEKIPYFYPLSLSRWRGISIVDYIQKWESLFYPYYKIVNLVRHPADVFIGNSRKRPGINQARFNLRYKACLEKIFTEVKRNIIHIKVEDILLDQYFTMKRLLFFLEVDYSDEVVNQMYNTELGKKRKHKLVDPTRAFAYCKNRYNKEVGQWFKAMEHIKLIRRHVPDGVRYEWY